VKAAGSMKFTGYEKRDIIRVAITLEKKGK